jgi:hypothetical protein
MTAERFADRAGKAWFLGRALAHTQFPGMTRVVDFEAADIISEASDTPPTFTML